MKTPVLKDPPLKDPVLKGLALMDRVQMLLAAVLGITLMWWLAWPGYFTYDSAHQLAEARGVLPLGDVHPPLMALVWRGLERIWAYPGVMFALITIGYWYALTALVWRLIDKVAWRWVVFVLIALWPPLFITMCHVWKDCALVSALLAACVCIVIRRDGGHPAWIGFAVLWLAVGTCLRHNAIVAAVPLTLWLCWPRAAQPGLRARATGSAIAAMLCVILLISPSLFARAVGAAPRHAWAAVALWDLAGISIREDTMLIPARLLNRPTSVADLAHDYTPVTNVDTFVPGRIKLSYDQDYTKADVDALWNAWTGAILHHPRAYLAHRLAFSRWQFLGYEQDTPSGLAFSPNRYDQAFLKLGLPQVDPQVPWLRAMEWLRTTPLFAGIWYVLIAIVAAVIAWRRRRARDPLPVLMLTASALGNALPLAIISGSCDFRYMIWTVLAALLALPLALLPARAETANP
jgi:hypothetical protein